jgi:hypothetical protein
VSAPPGGDRPNAGPDVEGLISLAEMLTQIDEFLRTGDHIDHHLADFLSTGPGDTGQLAAYCLIDAVSFTAHSYRRQAAAAAAAAGVELIQVLPDTDAETDGEVE